MGKAKISLDFDGLDVMMEELKRIGADIEAAAEQALEESRDYVNENLHAEMEKHHQSGDTEKSIKENEVPQWTGDTVTLPVGFDISNGGLPSIFLMYGTPTQDPDKKLYNAIFGSKTKKEIEAIQQDVFDAALWGNLK